MNVDDFVNEAALGPDALDPAFTSSDFASILANSKRCVKSVLMDQNLMAGGNIYSDEVLFQASIFPSMGVCRLGHRRRDSFFAF